VEKVKIFITSITRVAAVLGMPCRKLNDLLL